ncbi:MAG TPA: hypothetical protein VGO26_04500 [Amnibacterium sp.]|nr:hypothetical protein [Amnibacterium sp.]
MLGVGLLAVTLALCLLPGPIAACGSLLAPMFPLRTMFRCPSSQSAHVLPALVTGVAALVAGMIVLPHRRRRHHH